MEEKQFRVYYTILTRGFRSFHSLPEYGTDLCNDLNLEHKYINLWLLYGYDSSVFTSVCIKISCMNSKRKLYYHFDRNVFQKCSLRLLLLLIDFGLTPWRKIADGRYFRRREC